MFPIPTFFPAMEEDLSWNDTGSTGGLNPAGLHHFSRDIATSKYFDPKTVTPDDYYGSVWNELGGLLGLGEAGRQAVWNAKMQDWQNKFNAEQSQLERDFSAEQTTAQNAFNSAEALKERDWQEYMSSTAYQRAVKDLQAAGLNPVLAVSQPASSGQGAAAGGSALGASAFMSSALGANGVASGLGMSALSAMVNSAFRIYATKKLMNSLSATERSKIVRSLGTIMKFIK